MDLPLNERLIVAADFDPRKCGGRAGARKEVIELGHKLAGLGVYIKVNSILRASGYDLIYELREMGLKVMADLKLNDIPQTLEFDAAFLAEAEPELVTVMCSAGIDGMMAVKKAIGGKTDVMGVTVLTSIDEEECQAIFACSTKAGVLRFARMAQLSGLPDLVLSPQEAEMIHKHHELLLNLDTPAIRPLWHVDAGDQNKDRIMTPRKAFLAGASRIVVGRPIIGAKANEEGKPISPAKAVEATLREIDEALDELQSRKAV